MSGAVARDRLSNLPSSRPEPLLEVRDLRTWFQTPRGLLRAVDGVSFELHEGQTMGIVGESGSGKSVLVRSIMNLLPPNAHDPGGGRVLFDGKDVRSLPRAQAKHFWGPQIAMIFQDPMTSLNPVKKVGAQLTEAMRYHLRISKQEASDRALELMHQVGIPEPRRRLGQFPHELSGGMRQRVMIAIAISCEPSLLIADEPTTALDVTVQKQILDLLDRVQRERNMSMILITHDLGVVGGHADKVAIMYAGQFVEMADTERLFGGMRHPYTEALLNSIPQIDRPSHTRLEAISGRPPDMVVVPPGCRFAPRCKYAQQHCLDHDPELVADEHAEQLHRCFYPVGTAENEKAIRANREAGRTATGLGLDATVVS